MAFISEEHTNEYIMSLIERSRKAQREFEATVKEQRKVDEVVRSVLTSLYKHGDELAADAVAESGMGNIEAKKAKLLGSALSTWVFTRGHQSVGYKDCPDEPGIMFKFKPMGVVGAVMPSTNPLATVANNAMIALKCRNSVIVAPHPSTAHVSDKVIAYIREGLKELGVPEDLVLGIDSNESCIQATNTLIRNTDVNIATGGAGMVKSVYSAGKPAYGCGQGNCQEIIDRDIDTADYDTIAKGIIKNRTVDNGVPCTGDQTVHIPVENEDAFVKAMVENGAYLLTTEDQINRFRDLVFPDGGTRINRQVVGRVPSVVGPMFGEDIPETAKVIFLKNQKWADQDSLCREILFPVVRYTTYETFEEAVDRSVETLYVEGAGHSSSIWSHNEDHVEYASERFPVGRFRVNSPTGGAATPAGLIGGLTIGCGTWGGNGISDFVKWEHLYNMTKVIRPVWNLKKFGSIEEEINNFEVFSFLDDEEPEYSDEIRIS